MESAVDAGKPVLDDGGFALSARADQRGHARLAAGKRGVQKRKLGLPAEETQRLRSAMMNGGASFHSMNHSLLSSSGNIVPDGPSSSTSTRSLAAERSTLTSITSLPSMWAVSISPAAG